MTDRNFNGCRRWRRACEPDLPTYADIIEHHGNEFGFPALEISSIKFPLLSAKSAELSQRFYSRYCIRMIAYETLELWQLKLQEKFDSIADEYERAFRLYSANSADMDKAVEGTVNTVDREAKSIDTPDSVVNASDDYADTLQKGKVTAKLTVTGARAVESVNENITAYRDYESQFLKEFENLFQNIFK